LIAIKERNHFKGLLEWYQPPLVSKNEDELVINYGTIPSK
jgi:hypothetical protein